ncbi:MAG TPA: LysR family transcriptional regulator, partial [Ramlibacter sp.]
MRLTQLRSFYAVARAGSFTRAAEQLHVSQPTITTQVRFLEESYDVELFHRSGRRVRLTEMGEQLMLVAQQIFSLEAEAVELLKDAGELRTGHLRVAAVGPHHVTRMLV